MSTAAITPNHSQKNTFNLKTRALAFTALIGTVMFIIGAIYIQEELSVGCSCMFVGSMGILFTLLGLIKLRKALSSQKLAIDGSQTSEPSSNLISETRKACYCEIYLKVFNDVYPSLELPLDQQAHYAGIFLGIIRPAMEWMSSKDPMKSPVIIRAEIITNFYLNVYPGLSRHEGPSKLNDFLPVLPRPPIKEPLLLDSSEASLRRFKIDIYRNMYLRTFTSYPPEFVPDSPNFAKTHKATFQRILEENSSDDMNFSPILFKVKSIGQFCGSLPAAERIGVETHFMERLPIVPEIAPAT